jgi:hypothetical protein
MAFREIAHIHISADLLPGPQQGGFEQRCIHHAALPCAMAPFQHGKRAGIDLDRLIEAARLAERIIGRPLAGRIMHAGSLRQDRAA